MKTALDMPGAAAPPSSTGNLIEWRPAIRLAAPFSLFAVVVAVTLDAVANVPAAVLVTGVVMIGLALGCHVAGGSARTELQDDHVHDDAPAA